MPDASVTALADALRERYLLERELGAGGMATVYLAQDVRHHRRVALKVLKPELAAAGDGRPLLALATPVETAPRRIRIVTNWLAELEAKTTR